MSHNEAAPRVLDPRLAARIADLEEARAVELLALVLQQDGRVLDPLGWRQREAGLREAASDPALSALKVDISPSDGDLARTALIYLAESQPRLTPVLVHGLNLPAEQMTERFDPITLSVGALILLALQTEVTLEHDEGGRWHFRLHKQPMKESTLGTLLGKLIAAATGGGH
jgi:hypothetical protein